MTTLSHRMTDWLARAQRAIPRSTAVLMRIIGLGAALADGLLMMAWAALAGPKRLAYTGAYIGKLGLWFSTIFASTDAVRASLFFWSFLVLQLLGTGLFALCFWLRTSPSLKRSTATDTLLIALQILVALATHSDLLILIAAELAFFLPRREAALWLALQIGLFAASRVPFMIDAASLKIVCNVAGITPPSLMIHNGLSVGWSISWQAFAFCGGYIAIAEQRSRIRLAAAHAELVATQQLLSDAIRASERVRIARDLHDAIGHHLTALNLHLELAVRQAGGKLAESLQASRRLAQRLLAEVRVVVSIERRDQTVNLRRALETLCAGLPSRRIALSFDADVEVRTPALAHAIFCSVQDALGNSARQSAGIRLALRNKNDGLAISISEESKRMRNRKEDERMQGLRRRIEALGGTLDSGLSQGGINTEIWLPQSGAAQ